MREGAMKGRQLGGLTLARAVEMVMPFDRQGFFPETAPDEWAPYEGWLKPGAMDPATGALLFTVQSYVVRTSHHTILIDSCVGNHKERANRPLWHQKTDDTYMRALAALGLAPEDIDYVMCTHLHSDHVGWNTKLEGGRWVPTFPKARYVFTRKELEAWERGHPKFTRHPLEDSVLPVIAAGRAELVDNDFALDDEVWLEPSPGHTPDHRGWGDALRLSPPPADARGSRPQPGAEQGPSPIERSFAILKRWYGYRRVRYRSLVSNALQLQLLCIAMNLRRALMLRA
jgi:hypothetical protein